jgi:uncharacterized membrane protein HdeD (DUF308 family)
MSTELLAPAIVDRVMQRQAARWWWVPLAAGVVWFIISWLVLRADYTSLTTVGVIVGVAFLVAALNEVGLAAVMGGGWAVWHVVLAVILILGAFWAFVRPVNTFFALASVLGLLLLLQGLFTIMRGVALRDETEYWWLDLVGGILITLLGLWVSSSDGVWNLGARASFILLWVGFMAIFRGVSDVGLAMALRRFGHEDKYQREHAPDSPPVPPARSATARPAGTGQPASPLA